MRVGATWIDLEGLAVGDDRAVHLQRDAEVAERDDVTWIDLEGFVESGEGVLCVSIEPQRVSSRISSSLSITFPQLNLPS